MIGPYPNFPKNTCSRLLSFINPNPKQGQDSLSFPFGVSQTFHLLFSVCHSPYSINSVSTFSGLCLISISYTKPSTLLVDPVGPSPGFCDPACLHCCLLTQFYCGISRRTEIITNGILKNNYFNEKKRERAKCFRPTVMKSLFSFRNFTNKGLLKSSEGKALRPKHQGVKSTFNHIHFCSRVAGNFYSLFKFIDGLNFLLKCS